MRRYIFGFDANRPEACAGELRALGIDAVVTGAADARTEAALAERGIELYLCFGAFGLGEDFSGEASMARDAFGRPTAWFSSGCPNDAALSTRRLEVALERMRRTETARGLFVDGARFASFASAEGPEAFFTCFCPRCMEKMEALGLDAQAVRAAVRELARMRRPQDVDDGALRGWLDFRAACVSDYIRAFADAVRALPGAPLAAAFVFAPTLAPFVGQTPEALRPLDIVAPMLYRAYPHAEGPACLGHEWAALLTLFGVDGAETLLQAAGESGVRAPRVLPETLLELGFPPGRVGEETALASAKTPRERRLWPIVQIEDARLEETVMAAEAAGADAVGYFMYGQADPAGLPMV